VTATALLPAAGVAPELVRVFDSADAPADAFALRTLADGIADADLAAPAVVLPDFHLKDDKEMPSSIAVATSGTICPALSSASLNCGMTLVALDIDRPSLGAIAAFYARVRERYPYPPSYRRDLSVDEVVRCAASGAAFAAERWDVDPAELERVEEHGRVDVERFGGLERVRRELPWSVKQLSRIRFGTIGPSNHFIELQQVEEVLDARAAELLGVEEGQVTLQFHGGGGSLPGELGLLFAPRKRYPRAVRAQMAIQKPLYHLGRARSWRQARLRKELYFSGGCPPIDRDGPEGERVLLANAMAMNYGFAFRVSVYAALRALATKVFGARAPRLVVDSPHNSIYEEELDGESVLVHRHNVARAFPASRLAHHPAFGEIGQALLLPGTSRTSSYLCAAADGAADALFSACHGAGTTVQHFAETGRSSSDALGRSTLRFDYSSSSRVEVPQLDDRGIDEALAILTHNDVLRPVARMRPFAVLN
jgi:tRNA-splicing ligase RtcB (3'-phosphate/5'-hydroxy nucleic acid ligase)